MKTYGEIDPKVLEQIQRCAPDNERYALMGDNHLGYSMPIGGVVAYKNKISPSGVGYDIACLDSETEFLTETGWKKISEYINGDKVLQYDTKTNTSSFVVPLAYIHNPDENSFYHVNHCSGLDMMVTKKHKVIYWAGDKNRGNAVYKIELAEDLFEHHNTLIKGVTGRIRTTFNYQSSGSIPLSNDLLRVIVMVCADGCDRGNDKFELHFSKNRKIERCKLLLDRCGIPYKQYDAKNEESVYILFNHKDVVKDLNIFWNASNDQLNILSEECLFWDGHKGYRSYFSTKRKDWADIVQFANSVSEIRSNIYQTPAGYYTVNNTRNEFVTFPKRNISLIEGDDKGSFCFTVPSGFLVVRRNNSIFVTGNCGNCAVRLNIKGSDFKPEISEIMDFIYNELAFGTGKANKYYVEDDDLYSDPAWSMVPKDLQQKAKSQLGSIGSGNHYVDIFHDENDDVWIGVHFGSRGLGHSIATQYISEGGGNDSVNAPPVLLDVDSKLGQDYITLMNLAGRYAYSGREWVCRFISATIGGTILETVHNHHNFAWKETHFDEELWVVRKGATPAFPFQKGFVGGSMGENSVILQGVESEQSRQSLYSTVHGAGRVLGRKEAKGSYRWKRLADGEPKQLVQVREGVLKQEDMDAWVQKAGIELRGGGLDESPHCYKRLDEVLALHEGTIEILHVLTPLGVAMSGD